MKTTIAILVALASLLVLVACASVAAGGGSENELLPDQIFCEESMIQNAIAGEIISSFDMRYDIRNSHYFGDGFICENNIPHVVFVGDIEDMPFNPSRYPNIVFVQGRYSYLTLQTIANSIGCQLFGEFEGSISKMGVCVITNSISIGAKEEYREDILQFLRENVEGFEDDMVTFDEFAPVWTLPLLIR